MKYHLSCMPPFHFGSQINNREKSKRLRVTIIKTRKATIPFKYIEGKSFLSLFMLCLSYAHSYSHSHSHSHSQSIIYFYFSSDSRLIHILIWTKSFSFDGVGLWPARMEWEEYMAWQREASHRQDWGQLQPPFVWKCGRIRFYIQY